MPLEFTLTQRIVGFSLTAAGPEERIAIATSDLIPPTDAFRLSESLEHLQSVLFGFVPGFPSPSVIDHLLMIIRPDLSGIVYINEVRFTFQAKVNRAVEAGTPVYIRDIDDIAAFEPNVEVPDDCAVVVLRSNGWKRSLYFDFAPLEIPAKPRAELLSTALARQAVLLLGIPSGAGSGAVAPGQHSVLDRMAQGFQRLRSLLSERCEVEGTYQELLAEHPWMLGGQYESVDRHVGLDDSNIPDFTARRSWDKCHDILELKQPFITCFRARDGEFSAEFNAAWNQAERYVAFTRRQRDYLREEKKLRFDNPRCILILGYKLDDEQLKKVREKESIAQSITVLTYDQLLNVATHVLYLMRVSGIGQTASADAAAG